VSEEQSLTVLGEPELLRAYLAGRDVPCGQCGYNLRDLVGRVCPECNTVIALSAQAADPMWRYRSVAIWALVVTAAGRVLIVLPILGSAIIGLMMNGFGWASYGLYTGAYAIGHLVTLIATCWILWGLLRNRNVDQRPVSRAIARILWLMLLEGMFWGVMAIVGWLLF
jgi:hypothetical protein